MADPSQYIPTPPKQVRDQVAAAEAMYAQGEGKPEEKPLNPVQPPPGEVAPPVRQPDPQPPPPSPAQPPPQQPPPAAAQQPGEDDESWERRYKSLQGRHETMAKSLQNMERQLELLRAGGMVQPQQEPAPQPKKLVTDEELNEYGTEFFQVVGKKAREEVEPVFEDLTNRLKRLEGRVDGTTNILKQTQQLGMYDHLARDVPNWKDVNRSPQFKEWLSQPDPYSGRVKHELLKEAFTRQETNRVVNFFQGFLTEATGLPSNASSPGTVTTPLPGNGQGNGRPSLEDFAAPGRARSAPAGNLPSDKPTYTHADIAKFFADKRKGKWQGREADADLVERDIFQAQHEGRIFNS